MIAYVLSHWRGQHSLAWSFWVNLVGLRVLIFTAQSHWIEVTQIQTPLPTSVIYCFVLLLHGVLLIWQIMGVIRACDHHFAEHGSMPALWGAQLAAVVLFLLSAVYSLEAVQLTLKPKTTESVFELIRQEHASQYEISLSAERSEMRIDGLLALGITKAVNRVLEENIHIKTLVLNSQGGSIYEGRGLAKLVSEHQINTHVNQQCSSACTLAYIGGACRTAAQDAKFGFHQYRIDANYDIVATDVSKEQTRDKALFLHSGVSESFTNKMFTQVSSGMWWPDLMVLENSGFLHRENQSCRAGSL